MKILHIAAAEWLNKKLVAAGAFLLGFGALFLPLIYPSKGTPVVDLQTATALSFEMSLPIMLGLAFGAGMIAPDVQEGRVGFYLARPISPWVLWGGKLLGVILFVFISGLLVVLPVVVAHRVMGEWLPGLIPLAIFSIASPLIGHAFSIAFRARTPWLLLDFVTLGATIGVLLWFLGWMGALLAFPEAPWFMVGWGIMVVLALTVAGWQQVAKGRTDLKRSHRALSISLLAIPILTSIAAVFVLQGTEHMNASQMVGIGSVSATGRGPWVLVSAGKAGLGRSCRVALNTDSGQGIRVGGYPELMSQNGKRLVWLTYPNPFRFAEELEFWITDLGPEKGRNRATGIRVGSYPDPIAIDADGQRIAFFDANSLSVYDVDSGLLVAHHAFVFSHSYASRLVFLGPEKLRAFIDERKVGERKMSIYELDLHTARFVKTGTLDLGKTDMVLDRNPSTEKVLVRRWEDKIRGLDLCDARTGEVRKHLMERGLAAALEASFLSDGSILLSVVEAGECHLRHFDSDGNELWSTAFPKAPANSPNRDSRARLFGETVHGKFRVGFMRYDSRFNFDTLDVDLKSQTMQPSGIHRLPALLGLDRRELLGPPEPGSLATRLEVTEERSLEISDLKGQVRVLVKGPGNND